MIIHNFTNKDFNWNLTRTAPLESVDSEAYPDVAEELNAMNYLYIKKLIAVAKAAKAHKIAHLDGPDYYAKEIIALKETLEALEKA